LALHFGNTAAAHAVVLGVFLGGMAIGYTVIGIISDRVEDTLEFYGRLEIGIGLCGALAPTVFAHAPGWAAGSPRLEVPGNSGGW